MKAILKGYHSEWLMQMKYAAENNLTNLSDFDMM